MTEEERRILIERSRLYHAQSPEPKKARRSNSSGILCAAVIGVLLILVLLPEDISGMLPKAEKLLSEISLLSARIELSRPHELLSFSGLSSDRENNAAESGNNTDIDMEMIHYGTKRMPSSYNEDIDIDELLPPPSSSVPTDSADSDEDGLITTITYGKQTGDSFIDLPMGGQIRNITRLSNDEVSAAAEQKPDFRVKLNAPDNEPQLLIMHTHTTESYEPFEKEHYSADIPSRTTDNSLNMTVVGEVMAEVFESKGIRTYHDTTVHDYPSYNGSYDRSRETVSNILKKYPSIKVVLDVHRDAIERENGDRIAPTVQIDGKNCAQVMLICGCDDGTMDMPQCMKNLSTAALFQQYMESTHPGLTRPVLFDYRHYNQDLTTGSLLIEIGGHANSIDQALYAGRLSAEGIAAALVSEAEE